jgi:molybdate transport system regulatory protein
VKPRLRFRIRFSERFWIGIGKIELLEGIEATGSLVRAARAMAMSYRRAWLLLHALNTNFDEPVAIAKTGGRAGGGATLTPFGRNLVASYRALEAKVNGTAEDFFNAYATRVKATADPPRVKSPVKKRVKKKLAGKP